MSPEPLTAADLRVDPGRAALLVVDVQERLAAAMAPGELAAAQKNILLLVELARRLRMPVVVSEQYPKGLGPTLPGLVQALGAPDLTLKRFEKVEFGCTDSNAFRAIFAELARPQWIVVGMEAHVCVYQTARGLVQAGVRAHVPADAVLSRTQANRDIGLGLIGRSGGIVTSTEVVLFDALKRAGTDDFRALSARLKA